MFERFTDQAKIVVRGATGLAEEMGHRHIGTEHILLSMLTSGGGIAYDVLREAGVDTQRVRAAVQQPPDIDADALESIGIDLDAVRAKVEETFGPGALDEVPVEAKGKRHKPFTRRAKMVLELALREAIALKHRHIGSEHILLGLIREEGVGAKLLADQGVDLAELRRKTIEMAKPGAGGPRAK